MKKQTEVLSGNINLQAIVTELQGLREKKESSEIQALIKELPKANALVLFKLGICYTQGIIVKANLDFGQYLLSAAAEQWSRTANLGDPIASNLLAQCYEQGFGVKANKAEHARLIEQSKIQQKKTAEYTLTNAFAARAIRDSKGGVAFVFYIEEELRTLTAEQFKTMEASVKDLKSADVFTLCKLAICYFKGIGTKSDGAKVIEYLDTAIAKGFVEAIYLFAVFFPMINQPDVDENDKNTIAVKNLTKAANKGCSEAQSRLARAHASGDFGLSVSYATALKYHLMAAKAGHMYSAAQAGVLYINDGTGFRDPTLGVTWLIRSLHLGNTDAQQNLAALGITLKPAATMAMVSATAAAGVTTAAPMTAANNIAAAGIAPVVSKKVANAVGAPSAMAEASTRAAPITGVVNATTASAPAAAATATACAAANTITVVAPPQPSKVQTGTTDAKKVAEDSKLEMEKISAQLFAQYPERRDEIFFWPAMERELSAITKADFIRLKGHLKSHNPLVLFKVGACYLRGIPAVKNPSLGTYLQSCAIEQWRGAAELEDKIALHNLSQCHNFGLGVDLDKTKVAQLVRRMQLNKTPSYILTNFFNTYEVAREDGGSELCFYIEKELEALSAREFELMEAGVRDLKKAQPLILCKLAIYYFKGINGIKQDADKIIEYLESAMEKGFVEAYFLFGMIFPLVKHPVFNKDKQKQIAVKYFEKADKFGCINAQYRLGRAYFSGELGLVPSHKTALAYHLKAASAGHMYAADQAGTLYIQGEGIINDATQGVIWLQRALILGNLEAQRNLAELGIIMTVEDNAAASPAPAISSTTVSPATAAISTVSSTANPSVAPPITMPTTLAATAAAKDATVSVPVASPASKAQANPLMDVKQRTEDSKLVMERLYAQLVTQFPERKNEILNWPKLEVELRTLTNTQFEALEKLSIRYNPIVLFKMGICYSFGIQVAANPEMGQAFLSAATEQWQRAAALEDRIACYNLVTCYNFGFGVNIDKEKSGRFLNKAQQKTFPNYFLSGYFSLSYESVSDKAIGFSNFHIKEELKSLTAEELRKMELSVSEPSSTRPLILCKLALCYWLEINVRKDLNKARDFLTQAMQENFVEAFFLYALLLVACDISISVSSEKSVVSEAQKNTIIIANLKKAAELGCVEAQSVLALMHKGSKIVQDDTKIASENHLLAAKAGHGFSASQLLDLHGKKLAANGSKNVRRTLLERAALQGEVTALNDMVAESNEEDERLPAGEKRVVQWLNRIRRIPIEKLNNPIILSTIGSALFYEKSFKEARPYLLKAVEKYNYLPAMFGLGHCYYDPEETVEDVIKGVQLIKQAAKAGEKEALKNTNELFGKPAKLIPSSLFKRSTYSWDANNNSRLTLEFNINAELIKLSAEEFQRLDNLQDDLENASPELICKLAYCYFTGIKVKRNDVTATRLAYIAVEKGLVEGYYLLGMLAESSGGVRHRAFAYIFYLEAAENGCVEAQFEMSRANKVLVNNPVESERWVALAAKNNHLCAITQYAKLRHEKDKKEAFELWEKAARAGDLVAATELGHAYFKGNKGVSVDFAKAAIWFEMAAKFGHPESQNNAAVSFFKSNNFEKAEFWAKKAVETGFSKAAHGTLGRIFEHKSEHDKAFTQYYKGALLGDAWAMYDLGESYYHGHAPGGKTAENNYKAAKWIKLAADRKLPAAITAFARYFTSVTKIGLTAVKAYDVNEPSKNQFDLKKETEEEFLAATLKLEKQEKDRLAKEIEQKARAESIAKEIAKAKEPYRIGLKAWGIDKAQLDKLAPHLKGLRSFVLLEKGVAILKSHILAIQKQGGIPSEMLPALIETTEEHRRYLKLTEEYKQKAKTCFEAARIILEKSANQRQLFSRVEEMFTNIGSSLQSRVIPEATILGVTATLPKKQKSYHEGMNAFEYYCDGLAKCLKTVKPKTEAAIKENALQKVDKLLRILQVSQEAYLENTKKMEDLAGELSKTLKSLEEHPPKVVTSIVAVKPIARVETAQTLQASQTAAAAPDGAVTMAMSLPTPASLVATKPGASPVEKPAILAPTSITISTAMRIKPAAITTGGSTVTPTLSAATASITATAVPTQPSKPPLAPTIPVAVSVSSPSLIPTVVKLKQSQSSASASPDQIVSPVQPMDAPLEPIVANVSLILPNDVKQKMEMSIFKSNLRALQRTQIRIARLKTKLKAFTEPAPSNLSVFGVRSKLSQRKNPIDTFVTELNNLKRIISVKIDLKDPKQQKCLRAALMGHLVSFFRVCGKSRVRFVSFELAYQLRNNLFHVSESALLPKDPKVAEALQHFALQWTKFYESFDPSRHEMLTLENVSRFIQSPLLSTFIKKHSMMSMQDCNTEIHSIIQDIHEFDSLAQVSLFRIKCEARTHLVSRGHAITSEMRSRLNNTLKPSPLRRVLTGGIADEVLSKETVVEARRLIEQFTPLATYAWEYRHGDSEVARSLGENLKLPILSASNNANSIAASTAAGRPALDRKEHMEHSKLDPKVAPALTNAATAGIYSANASQQSRFPNPTINRRNSAGSSSRVFAPYFGATAAGNTNRPGNTAAMGTNNTATATATANMAPTAATSSTGTGSSGNRVQRRAKLHTLTVSNTAQHPAKK